MSNVESEWEFVKDIRAMSLTLTGTSKVNLVLECTDSSAM